jgi:hypothetical protein
MDGVAVATDIAVGTAIAADTDMEAAATRRADIAVAMPVELADMPAVALLVDTVVAA